MKRAAIWVCLLSLNASASDRFEGQRLALHSFIHPWMPSAVKAYLLDAAARTGKEGIRLGISMFEPKPGFFRWERDDESVRMAEKHGLSVVGVLGFGMPPWTKSNRCANYAGFAEAAASRYPQVRYWEIGNEPNLRHYFDGTSEDYASGESGQAAYLQRSLPAMLQSGADKVSCVSAS